MVNSISRLCRHLAGLNVHVFCCAIPHPPTKIFTPPPSLLSISQTISNWRNLLSTRNAFFTDRIELLSKEHRHVYDAVNSLLKRSIDSRFLYGDLCVIMNFSFSDIPSIPQCDLLSTNNKFIHMGVDCSSYEFHWRYNNYQSWYEFNYKLPLLIDVCVVSSCAPFRLSPLLPIMLFYCFVLVSFQLLFCGSDCDYEIYLTMIGDCGRLFFSYSPCSSNLSSPRFFNQHGYAFLAKELMQLIRCTLIQMEFTAFQPFYLKRNDHSS